VTALVLDDGSTAAIGGLTVAERASLLADRAGLAPVFVWGAQALNPRSRERLRRRGLTVTPLSPPVPPLAGVRDEDGVVVVGSGVLFDPAALGAFVASTRSARGEGLTALDAAPYFLFVPTGLMADVHGWTSMEAMAAHLRAHALARPWASPGAFCRRVDGASSRASVERDYIRHLNGPGESYFTKKIRRFSVPLTRRLAPLGVRPAQVTLAGLVLAVGSAWCLAQGAYALGLLGGLLYYASMVCDCSDGEVARVTLRDSAFGAWLETVVDYVTYFLLLAAVTVASQALPGADTHRVAAVVSLVGSIVVIGIASYLRHRVAAADPGQFDDASARALATATPVHRFARWGRQWIKRSTVAHLVVALALVDQVIALLYLWTFAAIVGSVVILAVEPFVVRRVSVPPAAHADRRS
jgi:phosphatidylglycerophosphate synthase